MGIRIDHCAACNQPIPADSPHSRFCGGACQVWASRNPGKPRPTSRTCPACGTVFPQNGRQRFCSALCWDVFHGRRLIGPVGFVITCEVCGRRRAVPKVPAKVCAICRPRWERRRHEAWRKANPEKQREIERTHLRHRRARRKHVASGPIDREAVFAFDNYICQLCGGATDPSAVTPAWLAPTIDHIVPLDDGGPDRQDNVQTAHFYCNSLKWTLGMDEFVRLYVEPHQRRMFDTCQT